jgi:hypothetical protein
MQYYNVKDVGYDDANCFELAQNLLVLAVLNLLVLLP